MTNDYNTMKEAGQVLQDLFCLLFSVIRPGTHLKDLDGIVASYLKSHGARSALKMQGFPGHISTCLNTDVTQGVPDDRVIATDDLVKLDLTIYYRGFYVDKARTFCILPAHYEKRYVSHSVEQCFISGLNSVKVGASTLDIGRSISGKAKQQGLTPDKSLSGHGIGIEPHMFPIIPNTHHAQHYPIRPGMSFTIEPIVFYGSFYKLEQQGFSLKSDVISGHWEDTIFIKSNGEVEVIT